ncbi:MAG: hypothetical protein PHV13_05305, partial [Candidatus ainarchaeum sp.]|nr:hypothetical protein [Candidatus ainarchaeum sp.]
QHAFGAAYYALKAVAAADSADAGVKIAKELNWQSRHLPKKLRKAWRAWQSQRLPKNLKSLFPSAAAKDRIKNR